jgi:PhnB protein
MSAVKVVPDGYHSIQPYLIFAGAQEAIAFYTKAFGAAERLCMKNESGTVAHAELQIGDCCVMLADENPALSAFAPSHYGGSPVSLMVYTEDCDAMYHRALSTGAVSVREPADQDYGDRTSGIKDPFGYTWWFATHIKDVSLEELKQNG